ncbi:uncharacterized protein LOC117642031 [Thrips palmi]|uniref:Uncharacterized protein LOC117642031 n=1 Tax=Thrips palmi TaxID=161013 RepID=A0A6P8YGN1_THRPL|nr:uncharacterized protein LOC117642031 [Thrips palmi]XP_034235700.1 uncharacterized protein LOC117642031 [Thrips palmi]XP_034235701.1 uncharacterized protein LOC117642031 [Thrips palmi]XP_034235702.1 uncharacterized protein LOC117642031 [Thrips palmi]
MDPKATKPHTKRVGQDHENLPTRRPNRLFLSETIPPATHQPQLSQNRTHNLSDRIHEYYENLVKNSPLAKTYPSRESPQFLPSNVQDRFEDPYLVDRSAVTVPRYGEQPHTSIRSALQPSNSNARQPFTVYVEDTAGAFQRYSKRKPLTNLARSAYLDANEASMDVNAADPAHSRATRERSKSPVMNRTQCVLCHSSNHSSQNCTLQSRMPAEHDGFFSSAAEIGPSFRHLKGSEDNQGDGSEDQKKATSAAFPKKRSVPANINVRCERDVIGQEKSPVSKSHPGSSGALSTSSSNGDTAPRERKKWVRPPLVGQAASSADKPPFINFDCLDDHSRSLEKRRPNDDSLQLSSSTGSEQIDSRDTARGFSHPKSSYFDSSNVASGVPHSNDDYFEPADHDASSATCHQLTSEGEQGLSDSCAGGRVSPSSSVTSSRRLEWDSGADVGYNQMYGSPNPGASTSGLCTIERMALAQGCSVALHLRLDPEGTTVPASPGIAPPMPPSSVQEKPTPSAVGKPTAESTPLGQAPSIAKALRKHVNDPKSVISPIFYTHQKDGTETRSLSGPLQEEQEEEEAVVHPILPKSKSPDVQEYSSASTIPFHRQLSNSMQDLRKCISKRSENQLLKSQSDPDLSGDSPIAVSKSRRSKLFKEMPKGRSYAESNVAAHSISSGSDATLVHVGTEEDLATDGREENDSVEHPQQGQDELTLTCETHDPNSVSLAVSESGKVFAPAEPQDSNQSSRMGGAPQQDVAKKGNVPPHPVETKPSSSNSHVCSDTDHKRGLHHHFGVLCSTVLGGHIQSSGQPNEGSQPQNIVHGSDRVFSTNSNQTQLQTKESTQDSENPIVESTGSSAFHSDAHHDESVPRGSTLTGRANSFEYLPGHAYENNSVSGLRKHERPPGISTSTETDSEPVRPISRVMHRKVVDSSSHDTEDDRLWGSPRTGSNTLVQDLERGVNLLKGVMENKSAGRRCKRELIRRIIKKLVTSEYVEDIIEKERASHAARPPFSPRRTKYHERQDRNLRAKRTVGSERQEISGESDEPKQQAARVHNVRRKLPTHQPVHHPQAPRTLSTLASGSKSSSLWSSHGDSTSGSISLSGSSDNQKQSKISVKPNPLFELNQEKAADWLKPTTQSEKLFEMRKKGTSHAEKHLAGLIGTHPPEHALDPMLLKDDPQKQLSWVTNEINHLKILKQLLQKQEFLKQSLNPNLCQTNFTTMPLTGIKQTMQMADCTSPDIPEARSPALKPSRLQQWISLESDTSAGFGLSNNTGSSHDSHWQEVEVASAGEQDGHPHRTVSISDADQITDASCSLSNRKSDHSSGPHIAPKSRRRSVSISDTDQQLGPPSTSDAPIQKKRSDCHCGRPDGRTFSTRSPQVGTYGPPPRNLASDASSKQVCENCASHNHLNVRNAPPSGGGLRSALVNRPGGSLGLPRFDSLSPTKAEDRNQTVQSCSCGSSKTQARNCCCSKEQPPGDKPQNAGPLNKGTAGSSHQLVSRVVAEIPSGSTQPLSGGGLVRVHIESDQDVDSTHESLRSSVVRDRVHIADVSELRGVPMLRQPSDDSITKAVSKAVSSKVKELRNLGQIEEAEVKIRVKVAPGQSDHVPSYPERGRVLKTQDLDDESPFHTSKHSELDDMIARQRAMDYETRQKLLSIAESRQRAQMGLHDVDRRIQDLLLQDYLSRQFKTPDTASTPQTRLNVRVEAPVSLGSSIGVQSEVDKKTIGTSTADQKTPQQRDAQSYTGPFPQAQQAVPPASSSRGGCICGASPARQAPSFVYQNQQSEIPTRPQTAPASRSCCCGSQPTSTPRTYRASPPFSSLDRQVEFELDLRKPMPCKMTPYDVHEVLKSRNTAYFLQFEEDPSTQMYPEKKEAKPPMEVVTVKIPMHKPRGVKPTLSSQERKKSKYAGSGQSPAGSSQSNQRGSRGLLSGSESPTDAANLLRSAPGRSHLSITVTDSSVDSVFSPDGDSRYSSFQHPSRKVHRAPRSNKRKEKVVTDSKDTGDISQTLVFRTNESKTPSSNVSVPTLEQQKNNNNQSANESESVFDIHDEGDNENGVPTLQEYLEKNHPKYLDAAEKRRRCIAEMSYLRRLRQQSRKRLMELEGDKMCARQKQQWRMRCASRARPTAMRKKSIPKVSKSACARRYMLLPESQQRMAELRKKEEKRTNRLMAEIYTRKLQEKVLKGSATIRSSVSVISSL